MTARKIFQHLLSNIMALKDDGWAGKDKLCRLNKVVVVVVYSLATLPIPDLLSYTTRTLCRVVYAKVHAGYRRKECLPAFYFGKRKIESWKVSKRYLSFSAFPLVFCLSSASPSLSCGYQPFYHTSFLYSFDYLDFKLSLSLCSSIRNSCSLEHTSSSCSSGKMRFTFQT